MDGPKSSKLKYVLDRVPPGFLVDSAWLKRNGVAGSSAFDYERAAWLERLTRGVYRRPFGAASPTDPKGWKIPVLSAQWIMNYDFHVGGMTALGLQGHSHYLALGTEPSVYLYGTLPTWFDRLTLDVRIFARSRQLFGDAHTGIEDQDFDPFVSHGASPWRWPLRMASPERAVLEALNEVPAQESFHNLDMAFEGLGHLRPRRLMDLLTACRSIKVRRLFLLYADRHDHGWNRHLDRAALDLGRGPRALVEGGKLNAAYQLMVPAEFAAPRQDTADGA